MWIVLAAFCALVWTGIAMMLGCSPSVPTPVQQVSVGMYALALEGCLARERAVDGGVDARMQSYNECAAQVEAAWGMHTDAGGK